MKAIRAELRSDRASGSTRIEAAGRRPSRRSGRQEGPRPSRSPRRRKSRPSARADPWPGRRVLITGVGSYIGSELARRLEADPEVEHVAGLDTRRPARAARAHRVHRGRHPRPGDRHADPAARRWTRSCTTRSCAGPGRACRARTMHDINVIGSLQLLTACEQSTTIRDDRDPRLGRHLRLRAARARSSSARRWPGSTRCARASSATSARSRTTSRPTRAATPAWSARCCATSRRSARRSTPRSPATSRCRCVPTYLGFDPRLQFVHEDDALDALVAAVRGPVRGAVNVAGPGTIGLDADDPRWPAGPPLPVAGPLFGSVTDGMRRARPGRAVAGLPPAAALRPGGGHHAAGRGGRLQPALHHRRRRSRTTSRTRERRERPAGASGER